MPPEIISTSSVHQNGVKVVVYGRAGVGKTRLAASAPNPIILSAEAGLLSLRDQSIPVIEITNMATLKEALSWAVSKDNDYETLCLDSLSEVAEICLVQSKQQCKDVRQAYGQMIDTVTSIIRTLRDLKCNVYITAKEERSKDDFTGMEKIGPSMPGTKLRQLVPYFMDEIFQLTLGKTAEGATYRYLRTVPDILHDAKDRSGALEPAEKPDLTYIFNRINNEDKQPCV